MPYKLHAVIIDKKVPVKKSERIAEDIIHKKNPFHRITEDSIRYRNIPKEKFIKSSFRSKPINKNVTLVFGKLKN